MVIRRGSLECWKSLIGYMFSKRNVDRKSLRIIEILRKDARTPKAKIAKELGITEAAVRKRIRGLEEKGIIIGYRALIDYRKAGIVFSFTGIDVEPEALLNIVKRLREIEQIEVLYLTTGDHNLMAEILCSDMNELEKVHEEIASMNGVRRICPAIVTEIVSVKKARG